MNNKKGNENKNGMGYYIALILCAAAIGISGYLYYANANRTEPTMEAPATTEDLGVNVAATEGTVPSEAAPKVTLTTCAPVDGQTVAEYAVDCLCYNQTTRDWRTHDGVDIAAAAGTTVCAAADGTVYTVCNDDTMGTTVVIRHTGGYTTEYASLGEEVAVKTGETVKMGQTIGTVGQTALSESGIGDHVHFAVTCDGKSVDPATFLK